MSKVQVGPADEGPMSLVAEEGAMSSMVDLVMARSLSRSLQPDFDTERVARELATLAGAQARPLERAIVRFDLAQCERPSWVVERARFALSVALERVSGFRV
jgi:hypothetical protein